MLAFDGDPTVTIVACASCGTRHDSVSGLVLRDDDTYAIYFVDWHPASGEACVDVVLSMCEESSCSDNVTFGCRIGWVSTLGEPACSLVAGGATRSPQRLFGDKLAREDALQHERLNEFWEVIDWLIVNDPTLHANVFHMPPPR